jgi:hypothetical protein
MATDKSDEIRRTRWLPFLVGLLAVGYPLSIGPAVWLEKHLNLPDEMGAIYKPLVWLADQSDLLGGVLYVYLSYFVHME